MHSTECPQNGTRRRNSNGDHLQQIHKNPFITFRAILITDRRTDTDRRENITSITINFAGNECTD